MSIFITSDTHFYHDNIIKYDNLPFENSEQMNEKIIESWNSAVGVNDEVWCLGDMFFCSKEKAKDIMDKLNGHKYLVFGNHDNHGIQWFLDVGFEDVSKHPVTINGFVHLQHEPPEYTPENTPEIWLYGHVHNSPDYLTINVNTACVCCSRWDFAPVKLNSIIAGIQKYRDIRSTVSMPDKQIAKQIMIGVL